ncbi:MAG: DeoR/GlpR family DNA-binding transcription regulator [Planctomycetota bacterium]
MLAPERHRAILERLAKAGALRVSAIAAHLGVTEETVRRDLGRLACEGRLLRTHGGAVALSDDRRDLPFAVRQAAHHDAKVRIARQALEHVREGDVIGLDASSTAHEVARLLPDIPVTVVCNALLAVLTLLNRRRVRVIATGGTVDPPSRSLVGSFAERTLEQINLRRVFLSSKGVDFARGLSELDAAQARIKSRMMAVAEEIILLVDHSKFGVRSVVFFGDVKDVDIVITDAGAPREVMVELEKLGIKAERAG